VARQEELPAVSERHSVPATQDGRVKPVCIDDLNALDVAELARTDDEIIAAVEAGLQAQGNRHAVPMDLSSSDVALGHAMIQKTQRLGIGQRLRLA
jgi:hypothetical protein